MCRPRITPWVSPLSVCSSAKNTLPNCMLLDQFGEKAEDLEDVRTILAGSHQLGMVRDQRREMEEVSATVHQELTGSRNG